MKDFFISYNKADKSWAEWIAWTLEEAGYSVVIQAWDFRPGENFVLKMQQGAADTTQTLAILSNDYLTAEYTNPEWAAAFVKDPQGKQRSLIPVRISACHPKGLLESIIYIDLVGLSELPARQSLLTGVTNRAKPVEPPSFPMSNVLAPGRMIKDPVIYPGLSGNEPSDARGSNIPTNIPTGIPFFTGREDVLTKLEEMLAVTGTTVLGQRQAISGLGGIGKTQTAIEYARRHKADYQAQLWAVAQSKESLISDFVAIARLLGLRESNAEDQAFTVRAVKGWLENNTNWLLILDNADDLVIIEDFLPETPSGHLIVTSRAQVFDRIGVLNPIELDEMTPEDARTFLLMRTGRHDVGSAEEAAIEQLAMELDYLPLALEQAAAYMKELRSSSRDYLDSYRRRGLELLEKGHAGGKYRKSVRTTWSLNFQQVEEASAASAELLRLSAFLNPDRIPVELISKGAMHLGPDLSSALCNVASDPLALDELLRPLIQYSLIHRDREAKTYDIHRLVQVVLREGMDEITKRTCVELLVKAFPCAMPDVDSIDFSEWYRIERLLPHAQTIITLIQKWQCESPQAADILNLTGRYLHLRGRLVEAVPLFTTSLRIREKILTPDHPDLATSLYNRAWLHYDQGEFDQAETMFLRALAIREQVYGPEDPQIISTLNQIGKVYKQQGRFALAESTLQRALSISTNSFRHPPGVVANTFLYLGDLFMSQNEWKEAEYYYVRSLELIEKDFGVDSPRSAPNLGQVAAMMDEKNRLSEAESLYQRSIAIYERTYGDNYPPIGTVLANLSMIYQKQNDLTTAEAILQRALSIVETGYGPNHYKVADCLNELGSTFARQRRYAEAELVITRALAIEEKSLGAEHPQVGRTLTRLANLYGTWRRNYVHGLALIDRALPIVRAGFGNESRILVGTMLVKAALLNGMNRKGEGQKLEAQARKIQARLRKKRSGSLGL
jgi:tetratricopeptide (TPR) repeat protein